MSKKTSKDAEKEEEKDLEEEEEESSDEDEDEDEDEEEAKPAAAKPAVDRRARQRERVTARKSREDHDDHDDHDEAPAASDEEDPYWWAPHAVMSVLVLIGVLGFFGVFNKTLGFLAAKPAGAAHEEKPTAAKETTPTTPHGPKPGTPTQAPKPGGAEAQPPREMFGAKHLLVMYKGGRRAPPTIERSKDEAKARAGEALKKAKSGKVKFEDLVKEYSDEPNAGQRGGDLGKFPKGAMVPEFQAALEKMKVGEISDLVETPFGFHVILRTQ